MINKLNSRRISILSIAATLAISSCSNKENAPAVFSSYMSPNVVDGNTHSELAKVTKKMKVIEEADTLVTDSVAAIDCYRWNQEYLACTNMLNEEDGETFSLNIQITLQESPKTGEYNGGLLLYVDEENFVEAAVVGLAEGNHITVYYQEDRENTTGTLFKHNDKLVKFEILEGEITASWYAPMHNFVDESTVISIR